MLYTTHYMEEAERLCDRIGIIDAGRLQAEGTRDDLIRLTGGVDTIRLGGSGGDLAAASEELRAIPGVERVEAERRAATLTVKRRARAGGARSSARRRTAGSPSPTSRSRDPTSSRSSCT